MRSLAEKLKSFSPEWIEGDLYLGSKPANCDIAPGGSLDLEKLFSAIMGCLGSTAST